MIKIIDTFSQIDSLFDHGTFNLKTWKEYINSIYDNASNIFEDDLKEYLDSGNYVYENDILPIINTVHGHSSLETLHTSFTNATYNLNERIIHCFGHELDIDIVLYIGLCNAAGWVTSINGRDVILLGVEKILELNWTDEDSMHGLIYHELGHVYHKQYGIFNQYSDNSSWNFIWQLFTEGIAMYFEQILMNDLNYYHQNINGWLNWCDHHFQKILADFQSDLPMMTKINQRYFGDWVNYCGRGDVGYYLGAKFVQSLCGKYSFEQLIKAKIDDIGQDFFRFAEEKSKGLSDKISAEETGR